MKVLNTRIINAVKPQPKKTLKDLVLGASRNNEAEVLKAIQLDDSIEQVANSSEVDLFLVSLDLKSVYKINANFLYVVQESIPFSFLMIPKSEKEEVSNLINFLASNGVGSIIEIHNVLGKKRYTVDDIKANIKEVVMFSGYVKHFKYETNDYPLPITNEYHFNSKVINKGEYFALEIPTGENKLSEHLSYFTEITGKAITPINKDDNGYYEYTAKDFSFISRLVLAYNFNPRRIAEVFKIPSEAFTGYLIEQYRYKPNHLGVLHYNDAKHDIALLMTYSNSNFSYNPYKIFNDVNVA